MPKNRSIDEELAALRGPKQWRTDDARLVLAEWQRSGEPMPAFARRHGIVPQRMAWWVRRLAERTTSPMPSLTLIPMTIRERQAPPVSGAALSLVIDEGGARVDVIDPTRVPASWFAAIVGALAGRDP